MASMHQEEPRRSPGGTQVAQHQGPLHQEEPIAHCTRRNPGAPAPGGTLGPLHQEEPRGPCTRRNPGSTAPGGTQGPLHQEEPRAPAPGGTLGPLHQEEPRGPCTRRNPGAPAPASDSRSEDFILVPNSSQRTVGWDMKCEPALLSEENEAPVVDLLVLVFSGGWSCGLRSH
ncbi:unnamed protein product [Pleuronectes platessa]|uniref:Uncharacterized protein n=1 Tax=Pleuronectes platessa TaxID=8262 RepID=A0A9N7VSA0_PLEPL|nr:unnamed protein product [Pleuronectes platessa]